MAWLYVPGQAASNLGSTCCSQENTALSVLSNGRDTLRPLSWRGWKRRDYLSRLSGLTYTRSQAARGVELWISSLRATRASRSVTQVGVVEKMTSAICGLRSGGLLQKFNRQSVSSRMFQGTLGADWLPSTLISSLWVTELRRDFTARQNVARRMFAPEYSSWLSRPWPTPKASRRTPSPCAVRRNQPDLDYAVLAWPTPLASDTKYRLRGVSQQSTSLPAVVAQVERLWPTPTACGNNNRKGLSPKSGDGLATAVLGLPAQTVLGHGRPMPPLRSTPGRRREQLNPDWVEQLMGWPAGLSACTCSATEWSRWLRRWRSWICGNDCIYK